MQFLSRTVGCVQVDGKRGYVNKSHIQEMSVLVRNLNYTVDTVRPALQQGTETAPASTGEESKVGTCIFS